MRIYEELFIIKPDATEEEIDQVIEQMQGVVTSAGGTIDKMEKWGNGAAYRVDKFRELLCVDQFNQVRNKGTRTPCA